MALYKLIYGSEQHSWTFMLNLPQIYFNRYHWFPSLQIVGPVGMDQPKCLIITPVDR